MKISIKSQLLTAPSLEPFRIMNEHIRPALRLQGRIDVVYAFMKIGVCGLRLD